VFRKLTGRGKLTEQEVKDAVREIRRVLLEADVNLAVARDLCKRVGRTRDRDRAPPGGSRRASRS